jgi:hypothetical protein
VENVLGNRHVEMMHSLLWQRLLAHSASGE